MQETTADGVAAGGGAQKRNRPPSTGRRKVPMQKIENKDSLQVSFSKRRQGLFKKAAEISILCGAQTAAVVFSPGGKLYSFAHPSADSVIGQYLRRSVPDAGSTLNFMPPAAVAAQGHEIMELLQKSNELAESSCGNSNNEEGFWWEKERIQEMGVEELKSFQQRLEAFRKLAVKKWGVA